MFAVMKSYILRRKTSTHRQYSLIRTHTLCERARSVAHVIFIEAVVETRKQFFLNSGGWYYCVYIQCMWHVFNCILYRFTKYVFCGPLQFLPKKYQRRIFATKKNNSQQHHKFQMFTDFSNDMLLVAALSLSCYTQKKRQSTYKFVHIFVYT